MRGLSCGRFGHFDMTAARQTAQDVRPHAKHVPIADDLYDEHVEELRKEDLL